jgi:hypothetical protein
MKGQKRISRGSTGTAQADGEKRSLPDEEPQEDLFVEPSAIRNAFWSFVAALLFWGIVIWFFFEPGTR